MLRQLERELMDDEAQAASYARADFSASNQFFADALARATGPSPRCMVDLGCGPAEGTIRAARGCPAARVTAIDGSAPMLAIAATAVRTAALGDRVALVRARLPELPLRDHCVDAVLSKDLLHHLPDAAALWREIVRLGRPGAWVQVMDLVRPDSAAEARRIVDAARDGGDAIVQADFYNSLCAAFTVDEVRAQLAHARLGLAVDRVSERHLLVSGRLS